MLVIVMKDHLLPPAAVCHNCPMASQSGLPRWRRGRLRCGHPVARNVEALSVPTVPVQYECAMGFRIAELAEKTA